MDSGDSVAFALPCSFPRNEGVIIRREKDYGVGRSLRTRSRLKWRFLFGDCPAVQYGIDKTPHWPQIIQSI